MARQLPARQRPPSPQAGGLDSVDSFILLDGRPLSNHMVPKVEAESQLA